jgi:hypothetical protein
MAKLKKITYNDCQIFEKGKYDLDEYFTRGKAPERFNTNNNAQVFSYPRNVGMPRKNPIFKDQNDYERASVNTDKKLQLRDNANNNGSRSINNNANNGSNYIDEHDSSFDSKEDNPVARNNFVEDQDPSKQGSFNQEKANLKSDITRLDYESLEPAQVYRFDNRSYCDYLSDEIIRGHRLANIIFETTLFCPLYVKVSRIVFDLTLKFCFNALLTTQADIDARALNPDRVY